jgi:hypothetical protein
MTQDNDFLHLSYGKDFEGANASADLIALHAGYRIH